MDVWESMTRKDESYTSEEAKRTWNARVGQHLECRPCWQPPFPVVSTSDTAGRQRRTDSVSVPLNRRPHNHCPQPLVRLPSHFQEALGLKTSENGRKRQGAISQTLDTGPPHKAWRESSSFRKWKVFKLQYCFPHWSTSKYENFRFAEGFRGLIGIRGW